MQFVLNNLFLLRQVLLISYDIPRVKSNNQKQRKNYLHKKQILLQSSFF